MKIQLRKISPGAVCHNECFPAVLFVIFFVLSWLFMQHTFSYKDDTFFLRHKVWSDFGAHIPLIRSFSMGDNFSLEHPLFPGDRMRYHFLFYSWVGLLEQWGLNIAVALNLLSAFGLALLMWLIFRLSEKMFTSRLAGLLAVLLFLFNGSLSCLFFFQKHPLHWSSWQDIITADSFASFGPWNGIVSIFWTLNIYTNQRHLALSYAVILLCLWPLMTLAFEGRKISLRNKIAIGMVAALAPFLHHTIIPVVFTYVVMWMIFCPRMARAIGPYYLFMFLCAVPALWYMNDGSSVDFVYSPGFVQQPKNWVEWAEYWMYNLGLYTVLIPFVFIWAKKGGRVWLASSFILFIVSNIWRFSPDMFNNHKLINFFMISVQIVVAGFLAQWLRKPGLFRAGAVAFLLTLTFSGVIDFFPILNDGRGALRDFRRSPAAVWIQENTSPQSVYLCTNGMNSPPSFLGRRIYMGYVYFPWSAGFPAYERLRAIEPVFHEDTDQESVCRLLQQEHIDYIVVEPGTDAWPEIDIHDSLLLKTWTPIFKTDDRYKIYSVKEECAETR